MKKIALLLSTLLALACATTATEPAIVNEIDIATSASVLAERWQGGNPFESELEILEAEARVAPLQIYGKVDQHLQINPPSIWRGDTRLLDFLVIGFVLKVESVTPGAVGPRFIPTERDRDGKVTKVKIEEGPLTKGDLVRVYLRLKRDHRVIDPAEAVAKDDFLWFSYNAMPSADLDAFTDDGVTPRMWSAGLNARRVGRAIP